MMFLLRLCVFYYYYFLNQRFRIIIQVETKQRASCGSVIMFVATICLIIKIILHDRYKHFVMAVKIYIYLFL